MGRNDHAPPDPRFEAWGKQTCEDLLAHGHRSKVQCPVGRALRNIQRLVMNKADLDYLKKSGGWEFGSGPSVVVVDTGMAKSLTTATLRKGVFAFSISQKGLMAGLGLQGSEITHIRSD